MNNKKLVIKQLPPDTDRTGQETNRKLLPLSQDTNNKKCKSIKTRKITLSDKISLEYKDDFKKVNLKEATDYGRK